MNAYRNIENKLNETGIEFTRNTTMSIDLFDGNIIKLGKKFKPLLQKFVNHVCNVAEANKVRKSDEFTLFSFAYPSRDNLALEVALYDGSLCTEVFSFRDEQYGVKDREKVMKHFLKAFNQWLHDNKK